MATMTADAAGPSDSDPTPMRRLLRADGGIEMAGFVLPYSTFASSAAQRTFITELNPPPPEVGGDILALRAHYEKQNDRLADQMLALFPVEVCEDRIGGVRVHRVTSKNPRPGSERRKLVCLHGGAFAWGANAGALVEAIPIASQTGVEVIAVDYRLGPEHRFPAASVDVADVYQALLQQTAPDSIGLYGCSAGAVLTAQAIVWIAQAGLPRPGAIAMLGGGGEELLGDSTYLAALMEGYAPPFGEPFRLASVDYLAGASTDDPRVFPGRHPQVLAKFPPTLLIAGGRDLAASCVTNLHLSLDEAGVEALLYIFDGLWHAFQIYPDLPESQRVYRIMAAFFDRHLAA